MIKKIFIFIISILLFQKVYSKTDEESKMTPTSKSSTTQEAIFAMGCFWCGESEFRDHETNDFIPGVIDLKVGYAGGTVPNPTYENHKGYKEAVKVTYDPTVITYEKLLDIFWHNVDPFDGTGQFCDKGFPYTSVIFYEGEDQKTKAEVSKKRVAEYLKGNIQTELTPKTTFYDAEDYHQNYKSKSPTKYKFYRWNCGRDKRLKEVWG